MGRPLPLVSRRCGPCQMCCVLPSIAELDKPMGVPCRHLTKAGCGIYETRPQVCRDFECNWLEGEGSQLDRPDIARAYVSRLDPETAPGIALWTYEHEPTRWQYNGWLKRLVKAVVAFGHTVLVFVGPEETRVYTKDPKVLAQLDTIRAKAPPRDLRPGC